MPLLDHFRTTTGPAKWTSVHAAWSGEIMRRLNGHWLGERFVALERMTVSEHSEIDIAAYDTFIPPGTVLFDDLSGTERDSGRRPGVRRANLHNEIALRTDAPPEAVLPDRIDLYAATYRPATRNQDFQIDVWTAPCAVGQPLPTMPMRLTGDTFVPVEFELAYTQACRWVRLIR